MKRPRILVRLMVERRERAAALWSQRRYIRQWGVSTAKLRSFFARDLRAYPLPRITVRSMLRLAVQNKAFARSAWQDTSTEYYSTCGNDDYQAERRSVALACSKEYRKAARYLASR
jgi:hypothetical protein